MIRKNDIRVPDGYFEQLQARLSEIPSKAAAPVARPVAKIRTFIPYAALAACMLLAVTVGGWILRKTAGDPGYYFDEESYLASLTINMNDPDSWYPAEDDTVELTDEDRISYLIESDIYIEQLNYTDDYENN